MLFFSEIPCRRLACSSAALIALTPLITPAALFAAELRPYQTIVSVDGKKMVAYEGEQRKLVFYDGLGDDAKVVKEVDCKGLQIVPSLQGKYVALCSQFINGRSQNSNAIEARE